MSVPKVAIIGRPNVGKSSLLNWLTRRRISVVDPTAGVTRDRVTFLMHEKNRYFELVDTGGIGIVDEDDQLAVCLHQRRSRVHWVGLGERSQFFKDATMKVAPFIHQLLQAITLLPPMQTMLYLLFLFIRRGGLGRQASGARAEREFECVEYFGDVVVELTPRQRVRGRLLGVGARGLPPGQQDRFSSCGQMLAEKHEWIAGRGRHDRECPDVHPS